MKSKNNDNDDDDDDDNNNNNTAMGSVHARGDTFLTFGLKALTETNTSRLANVLTRNVFSLHLSKVYSVYRRWQEVLKPMCPLPVFTKHIKQSTCQPFNLSEREYIT
jgi:hypothetical protein